MGSAREIALTSRRRPFHVLPFYALSATPKSLDLEPGPAVTNPSAASPRLNNSRTAAARLGMRQT